jgi:putative ABC transport system permease protein
MYAVWQDLRLAWRQLRRSPAFTVAVILTLAAGIGLNAAIFTMVDCVLLRPLGYHDADRIYGINTRFLNENRAIPRMGGDDYTDMARDLKSIEAAAYYSGFKDGFQFNGRTYYVDLGFVSPRFGQVMGVEPVAGRLFHNDVDGQEALLSSRMARDNFGTAAGALGKPLRIEGKVYTVVGVLPDGFDYPKKAQVWVEASLKPEVASRSSYNQQVIVKVRPGVTAATLNAELATLSHRLATAFPDDKNKALEAVSLQEQLVGKVRPILRLLMGSVGVLLLIVCANITHLQLVRGTQLKREVTIRTALGASRWVLALRAALEVLLLATVGCSAGVLVAVPALRGLIRMAPPELPRLGDVHLNLDVVLFSFAVSLITMAATALLPLWRSWKVDPAAALKQDAARGTESHGSGRLRQGLIAGEVALTLMLSVAAVLLVRQLIAESKQDLGFEAEHLVMLDAHSGAGDDQMVNREALDELRAQPGVLSAAAACGAPMGGGCSDVGYAVHGKQVFAPGSVLPNADVSVVTSGYFATMGMRLMEGRDLAEADDLNSQPVLVISASMVRQSFAGEDPIGKQVMFGLDEATMGKWMTIVGVVNDVRADSPGTEPGPTIYVPLAQHVGRWGDLQLAVRTRTDPAVMAANLTRFMQQKFPQVAVKGTTMRVNIGESERAQHFRTLLFGSFAGVSILLAVIGMFGVTAYTVAQKRFEFALRFALGAQRGQVLGSVLRSALLVSAAGVVFGVAMSLALMRVMGTLLGKVAAFDPAAYGIAAGGVLLVALLATLQPAWRAATVEPMRVLRDE